MKHPVGEHTPIEVSREYLTISTQPIVQREIAAESLDAAQERVGVVGRKQMPAS